MRAIAFLLWCATAVAQDAQFLDWMNGIAQRQLVERAGTIAQIRTTAEAEARKKIVRGRILQLMGGLPDYRGPLNPRVTGVVKREGFEIRKVIFDSLPGIFVTANVYVPSSAGMHPGILLPLGHWEQGKTAVQLISSNLALRGFVVLAYDPVGQGERQQAFDKRTGKSLAGGPTEQHFMLGAQSLLVGQSFARYRIWDARRGLDYLVSMREVDPSRIGVTGCSGGGTLTTYISALDERVKVAAPACYMNSFATLFPGDVGDSEQSLPGFLSSGLDQTDYVEMFAPKPWLISSTEGDFFTPAGAKQVYDEARHWYGLYGAEEKVHWVVGPGGHGTPLKVRQAIYDWMEQWLMPGKAHVPEVAAKTVSDHELWAAEGGQVSNLPNSRDLYLYVRESLGQRGSRTEMMAELRRLLDVERREMPPLHTSIAGEGASRRPAVLMLGESKAGDAFREDRVVSTLTVAGLQASRALSGGWLPNTRMSLIGRNLPMLRVAEILAGVEQLRQRSDVDPAHVSVAANGVAGVWALIAAALDNRIDRVWVDRTPFSLRGAFDSPVHENLHDAVILGFAKKWDLDDVVAEIGAGRVIWTDPTDWMRNVVPVNAPYVRYRTADESRRTWVVPPEF